MPFTVETGAGVPDANTWTDDVFADNYFLERGIASWAGVLSVKQVALIKATDYIHSRFGARWIPVGEDGVETDKLYTFNGTIPILLKRAQCEYALRALTAPLAPDPVVDENGMTLVVTAKTLGPLEKKFKVVGNGDSAAPLLRSYPAADMLLTTLLNPASGRTYR
jgi:hypothetical protein